MVTGYVPEAIALSKTDIRGALLDFLGKGMLRSQASQQAVNILDPSFWNIHQLVSELPNQ